MAVADSWKVSPIPPFRHALCVYDGFDAEPVLSQLQPGARIDRYGDESGSFFSPEGVPWEQRGLYPSSKDGKYTVYEVLKPLDIKAGNAAPWFDQPGGGLQFKSNLPIEDLIKIKIISPVN